MSKIETEDGTIINTDKAEAHWEEATWWNGHNHVSMATGDQWVHQTLYKSSKNRYYLVTRSQWQGVRDSANFLTEQEAAKWLILNNHKLPKDLAKHEAEIEE